MCSDHRLIPWDNERSDQTLQAFNAAFEGHWGLPVIDEDMWKNRFIGVPQFRSGLSYLAVDEDRVMGLCVNWLLPGQGEEQRAMGWIEEIGVWSEFRGRGIRAA